MFSGYLWWLSNGSVEKTDIYNNKKYELRDNRHRNPTRILYMANRNTENKVHSAASIFIRRSQTNKNLTAEYVRGKDNISTMVNENHGYVSRLCYASSKSEWIENGGIEKTPSKN